MIKNAIAYITRKRNRTLIIFIILTIVLSCLYSCLTIMKSSNEIEKTLYEPAEGRFQEARLMDMSHDLTLSGWATDSNDPDSFFRPLLSCAAIHSQTNLAHWCDPKFDSVLRKALSSQQLAARIEAYDEAQSILAQELPILPLASSLRLQAYRYDIKGLVLSPFGNASFAGVYREKQDEVKKP